jgi:hypothetical protein
MKHLKIFGLAIVAMFALSAAAVSSASATEFHASVAPGTLLSKLVGGPHKFKTSAGTVECTSANGEGAITANLALIQLVLVHYAGCKVTAPISANADVTLADYLFSADGTVQLDNTVTILPLSPDVCTITVGPQTLSGITYANIAGPPMEIEVKANVSSIHYTIIGGGGFCGTEGAHTDGTYTGNELAKEDGGQILVG